MGKNQTHVIAFASQVVLNALPDKRTSVQVLRVTDLIGAHPNGADDAAVELACWVKSAHIAGVSEAQVRHVFVLGVVSGTLESGQVNAHQRCWREGVCRLLKGLSRTAVLGAFARIKVPSRIIQSDPLWRVFFDEQVSAILAGHDGRNGRTGFPTLT